jgi:hypothetical protein
MQVAVGEGYLFFCGCAEGCGALLFDLFWVILFIGASNAKGEGSTLRMRAHFSRPPLYRGRVNQLLQNINKLTTNNHED